MDEATDSHQIMCRTCSKVHDNLFNMYDKHTSDKAISEKLMECTDIKVQKDDGLSASICDDCLKKLNLAYDFRQMVVKVDEWLHNHCIQKAEIKLTEFNKLSTEELIIKEEDPVYDNTIENMIIEKKTHLKVTEYSDNFESHVNSVAQNYKTIEVIESNSDSSNTDSLSNSDISNNDSLSNSDIANTDILPSDLNILNSLEEIKQIEENYLEKNQKYLTNPSSIDEGVDEDADSPIKSLDISEYEKLKTTLTRAEKYNTRLYCKECKRSYRFGYYFRVHVAQHTGQLPYKCEICGRAFAVAYFLRQHQKSHANEKPYKCKECGKAFKYQSGIQSHMLLHTGERSYQCHLCERAFAHPVSLTDHIRRHNSEKPFVCEICGKSFISHSSMSRHAVSHNPGKESVCSICRKSYKSSAHLRIHLITHRKPHKCSYCDKTFATKFQLTNHITVHTGERKHPCKICGKLFKNRCTIYRHMRVHTGETPFPCELCPEKFKYSHHLKNHVKVHHK